MLRINSIKRRLTPSRLLNLTTCRRQSSQSSDPLRILFCGSDEFSCASLDALHREKSANPSLVSSIDVVVRPGKAVGRGLTKIRNVPLKSFAGRLGIPIHERDTFTGWTPAIDFNLVVAVSFGLFVPRRILRQAKYGGLNVHPSFLPDLRGPAPLHHALLEGDSHVGVTLQTLDEKSFDHGVILAQTPRPGLALPPHCTVDELVGMVSPVGASLLVDSLRKGLHIPPLSQYEGGDKSLERHAPKFTKLDQQINWDSWTAEDIQKRLYVLGPLWTNAIVHGKLERLIIHNVAGEATDLPTVDEIATSPNARTATLFWKPTSQGSNAHAKLGLGKWQSHYLPMPDRSVVLVVGDSTLHLATVTVAGKPARAAVDVFAAIESEP